MLGRSLRGRREAEGSRQHWLRDRAVIAGRERLSLNSPESKTKIADLVTCRHHVKGFMV